MFCKVLFYCSNEFGIYIYIRSDQKVSVHLMITIQSSGAQWLFDNPAYIYIYIHTYTHTYIYIYIYMWAGQLSRYSGWLWGGRFWIESRWGRDFPPGHTCPGGHPASCKMVTGALAGLKCGRGVLLITHPLLVPRSCKSRATPLPNLWVTPGR